MKVLPAQIHLILWLKHCLLVLVFFRFLADLSFQLLLVVCLDHVLSHLLFQLPTAPLYRDISENYYDHYIVHSMICKKFCCNIP